MAVGGGFGPVADDGYGCSYMVCVFVCSVLSLTDRSDARRRSCCALDFENTCGCVVRLCSTYELALRPQNARTLIPGCWRGPAVLPPVEQAQLRAHGLGQVRRGRLLGSARDPQHARGRRQGEEGRHRKGGIS